ncbi:MAG TPA: agmatinase [Dehalococcoidia bacterium]|nr:agmatinase [Dehalococcoidia bacterium]
MSDQPAFTSGGETYLRVPRIESVDQLRAERPDVVIVGAPVDWATTHRPGARFGPRAIRAASNLRRGAYHLGLEVYPLKTLRVFDYGDAEMAPGDIERSHAGVKRKVREVVDAGAIPVVLGGDHSITYPSASAVAEARGPGSVGVIHFDAHADTADEAWGVALSHGTPMRRLITSGAVPGPNFVQIGLRGYWPPDDVWRWMREQGMRWHLMEEVEREGIDRVLDLALEELREHARFVYLSVDVDVLDPGFAPGTGTPEPGGFAPRELLRAVRRIALETELVAMDVVEVAPPYDGPAGVTAEVAHRVVLEVLSALAHRRAGRTPGPVTG